MKRLSLVFSNKMICTLSSIYKLHFTQNLISQFDEYENSAKMMLPNTDYSDALKPAKKNLRRERNAVSGKS